MPFHLKKKVGVVAHFGKQICKNRYVKMWARKNKNRPVSGFFTKIAYFQVMNFIPVKVSTLYSYINLSLYVNGECCQYFCFIFIRPEYRVTGFVPGKNITMVTVQ
jgi:hypothetical protein